MSIYNYVGMGRGRVWGLASAHIFNGLASLNGSVLVLAKEDSAQNMSEPFVSAFKLKKSFHFHYK